MVKVNNNISNIGSTQFNVAKANEDAFSKYNFTSSISIYLFAFNTAFPLYSMLDIPPSVGVITALFDFIILVPGSGLQPHLGFTKPAGICFSP